MLAAFTATKFVVILALQSEQADCYLLCFKEARLNRAL